MTDPRVKGNPQPKKPMTALEAFIKKAYMPVK
jgi:hypothetical protein